jgi:2,4-dichlorophenol 6-monooxygenase
MTQHALPEFDTSSPLRPARFGHIVVKSSRFTEMNRWYKTLLNAEPMYEGEIGSFLTYDDEHHRVFILNDPTATARDPKSEGVAHWAYLFNSLDDLLTTYSRLKGEGILPTYCVNHGFQVSFYFHDPDNNEVELGCDVFPTRDELNAWFGTGAFARDQFGFICDPEAMLNMQSQGMSASEIFEATYR